MSIIGKTLKELLGDKVMSSVKMIENFILFIWGVKSVLHSYVITRDTQFGCDSIYGF